MRFRANVFAPTAQNRGEDADPGGAWFAALQACVDEGLCRHIGVSNFTLEELDAVIALGGHPPFANQVELQPCVLPITSHPLPHGRYPPHPSPRFALRCSAAALPCPERGVVRLLSARYNQQQALVEGCIARGVRPVAFSPLGSSANAALSDPAIGAIAERHSVSAAQVSPLPTLRCAPLSVRPLP